MSAPGIFRTAPMENEPVRSYRSGSPERASLQAKLAEMSASQVEMPLVIGGREVTTNRPFKATMPHDTAHVLGTVHWGSPAEIEQAIKAAAAAWPASNPPPRTDYQTIRRSAIS